MDLNYLSEMDQEVEGNDVGTQKPSVIEEIAQKGTRRGEWREIHPYVKTEAIRVRFRKITRF